jgi:hypothetical protein
VPDHSTGRPVNRPVSRPPLGLGNHGSTCLCASVHLCMCLHPQVPRTYHHGEKGTFMIKKMHELYFARIAHNTDPRIAWPATEWPALRAQLRHGGYVCRTGLELRTALAEPGQVCRSQR